MSDETSLTNHLLIAMPSLADPNFAQTVALICEHTDKGALGIVLNKPLPMRSADVLDADEARTARPRASPRSRCCAAARCTPIAASCCIGPAASGNTRTRSRTPSRSPPRATCSRAMARGEGPEDAFIALGYAGWEAGQLEREIQDNAWLSMPRR